MQFDVRRAACDADLVPNLVLEIYARNCIHVHFSPVDTMWHRGNSVENFAIHERPTENNFYAN